MNLKGPEGKGIERVDSVPGKKTTRWGTYYADPLEGNVNDIVNREIYVRKIIALPDKKRVMVSSLVSGTWQIKEGKIPLLLDLSKPGRPRG